MYVDAHLATFGNISQLPHVWQRVPECGFPLQAWEKSSFNSYSRNRTRIGASLIVLGRGNIVKVIFCEGFKKGLLAVLRIGVLLVIKIMAGYST